MKLYLKILSKKIKFLRINKKTFIRDPLWGVKYLLFRNPSRFMIFAFERTGSFTLSNLLEANYSILCKREPFKYDKYRAKSESELERSLSRIYGKANGFKHLASQLERRLNLKLLQDRSIKVIFLWRTNALKRCISKAISMQSGEWGKGRDRIVEKKFEPISEEWIQDEIVSYLGQIDFYRKVLEARSGGFLEITYEDLLGEETSLEGKKQKLQEIFSFIGCGDMVREANLAEIEHHLSPQKAKLNSRETYKQIPNIVAIEESFGNASSGYLFK